MDGITPPTRIRRHPAGPGRPNRPGGPGRLGRLAVLPLLLLALAACATGATAPPDPGTPAAESARDRDPRLAAESAKVDEAVRARFGGAYDDPAIVAYVEGIGRRLAAVSGQADEPWQFAVLDTPDVNAFALPGGQIYVTRGLVALAGDEAELAGVIGHEIGHVTAGHAASRRRRGTVAGAGVLVATLGLAILGVDPAGVGDLVASAAGGVLAGYSRDDEREADTRGIAYLAEAGYDPSAQADFLESLGRSSAFEAERAGKTYDPEATGFFATHPATGGRVRQTRAIATAVAARPGTGNERGRARHLAAIDGMAWGANVDAGIERDGTFLHRPLNFAFDVAPGHRLVNRPDSVITGSPEGARLLFQGTAAEGRGPYAYLTETWAPSLLKGNTDRLVGLERLRIGGDPAARAFAPATLEGRRVMVMMVAIRRGPTIYRFLGLAPADDRAALLGLAASADSFRRLTGPERRSIVQPRITIATVRPGDTEASLARRMAVEDDALALFRLLNDRQAGDPLSAGDRVKLIR
ncbi:MAG: M48 family metalloprotease [Pseudomonadota bacterium]